MKNRILIWIMLCGLKVTSQNIIRIEYFFDNDPGFGNGISIPIVTGSTIANLNATISLSSISEGKHMLYVRSQDDQGNWSITNKRQIAQMPHIVAMEYFFDTDPGFGNGIQIPVATDTAIHGLNVNIDLTNIGDGIHTLFIRSRDNYGHWSLTNRREIAQIPRITAMEYFFDIDPGFGNGIPILISADTAIANLNVLLNVGFLTSGMHTLFIRSKDGYGKWSLTNRRNFNYCPSGMTYFYQDLDLDGYGTLADSVLDCVAPAGYVANFEDCDDGNPGIHQKFPFYSDSDSDGFGSGNPILICAQDMLSAPTGFATNNSDCNDNDPNIYAYFPFFTDADGDFFVASLDTFYFCSSVYSALNTPPPGYISTSLSLGLDCDDNQYGFVSSFPFYIDSDHDGYGTGTQVQVCANSATLPPPGYSILAGDCNDNNALIHPGAMEICDGLDNNCDGLTDTITVTHIVCGIATSEGQSFTLTAPPGKVFTSVDFASYGTPNGTCGNFTLGACHASSTMPVVQALVIGQNSVTLTQNYQIFGDPCVGVYKRFYVQASYTDTISLKYPFFADADADGYGAGSPVFLCATNANTAPAGYSLNGDDCDDTKSSVYPGVTDRMEYFIDNDPGPGNGTPITLSALLNTDTINQSLSISLPTNLSPGHHVLATRIGGCAVGWGLFEHRSFIVTPAQFNAGPLITGELFFDNDPGLGNGFAFSVPMLDTVNQTLPVGIPDSVTPGLHVFAIRVKDSLGQWSHFYHGNITILPPLLKFPLITAVEYFIDTDPGVGNATSLSITHADTLNQTFSIQLPANLNEGIHLLGIRVKDSLGKWGLFENRAFYIDESGPQYNPIAALEYFADADPGVGNGTVIALTPSDTIDQTLSLSIPTALLSGNHKLGFRVKNVQGRWSFIEFPSLFIQVKAFLQGYYTGQGMMQPVLQNQGQLNASTDVDTVYLDLHQATPPYNLVYTTAGIMQTNGNIFGNIPSGFQSNSYYLALRHRNTIQTWTSNPMLISFVDNLYDFTTSANKGFGDNLIEVEPGLWALFSGDLNQDENIDLLDASILELGQSVFAFGYYASDINGDGNVDLLDNPILESNADNFIFSNHP